MTKTEEGSEYSEDSACYVTNFIKEIRDSVPSHVPIVIGVENLPALYAALFEAEIMFKRIENVYMVYASNPHLYNGVGVPCNHNNSDVLAARGNAAKLFDGYCRVAKKLITICNVDPFPFKTIKSYVIDLCSKQLKNFEIDEKGKVSGKHGGHQDDFCSAVIKACQTKYYLNNLKPKLVRSIYDPDDNIRISMAPDISVEETRKITQHRKDTKKRNREYERFVQQRTDLLDNHQKKRTHEYTEEDDGEQQNPNPSKKIKTSSPSSSGDEKEEYHPKITHEPQNHQNQPQQQEQQAQINPNTGRPFRPIELLLRHNERSWTESQKDFQRHRELQQQQQQRK